MSNAVILTLWAIVGVLAWHRAFKNWFSYADTKHGLILATATLVALVVTCLISMPLGPLTFFVFVADRE